MPDFYSGATNHLGCFIEGFSLRRVHMQREGGEDTNYRLREDAFACSPKATQHHTGIATPLGMLEHQRQPTHQIAESRLVFLAQVFPDVAAHAFP